MEFEDAMAEISTGKSSLIVYIGTRNFDKLSVILNARPEIELVHINEIGGLKSILAAQAPSLIILEQTNELGNISSVLSMIQRICMAPLILIASSDKLEDAVTALRSGAYNYIPEPVSESDFTEAVIDALRKRVLWTEIHDTQSIKRTSFGRIIGSAPCMQVLYQTIINVSDTDATVLIQGPSGTGKELVARCIHENSSRSSKPFIAINCGAIPPNLLESELFGHERGAFTGAFYKRIGRFEQADGGTLFLDEVGEMPLDLQVKLLRIIQDMCVVRIGGKDSIPVNARLVCATNRNLIEEVRKGRFREDLYYRLNVVPIKAPPLSDRRADIPLLLAHFLAVFTEKYKKPFYDFSSTAMSRLCAYNWPGNVREMENMIERIVVLFDSSLVEERFLPEEVIEYTSRDSKMPLPSPAGHSSGRMPRPQIPSGTGATVQQESAAHIQRPMTGTETGIKKAIPIWKAEIELIKAALAETDGDIQKASSILEIGPATLYRKIKKYGIPYK